MRVYQAPKEPPPAPRPVTPPMASSGKPITWQLPPGWAEVPNAGGEQFGRVATIQVAADDPTLQLTVNRLDAPGSGEILPNLNRWEGQLGLPPSPAADAEQNARKLDVDGHGAFRIDLTGTDQRSQTPSRLLGVIAPHGAEAWSFKLQGDPAKVAAQESAFDAFVASVRFTTHDHDDHAAAPASTQPLPAHEDKSYALTGLTPPAGWERDTSERQMRVATLFVGEGNDRAELIVTKFAVDRFGTMLNNVNRWRGEVGLPPAADEFGENFRQLTTPHGPALAFDFLGPASPAAGAAAPAAKRSYVTMLRKGRDMWFVKLIGPADAVAAQRANYEALIQSLQFGEAGE